MALSTGSLLAGRYEITAPIAVGGMGEVWRARDRVLDRTVAAKVLRSEYTGDPNFLARFRNEARHTAALTHPNIASVYDYGETRDENGATVAYLVMEFVEGQTLVSILHEEGRLPVDWTLHVLGQAADGLSAAHRAGVVHRDIKPGNLMVRPDGVVKLTDFGIAQARDATPLTRTGMVVGTAQYLSPEQAQGMEVAATSDVYSLGVVAYECLAGARPFDGTSQIAIALAHINKAPPPLPADVPPVVQALIGRALAKDPAERFPDGGAFAEAIRAVEADGRPPGGLATGALAGGAIAAAAATTELLDLPTGGAAALAPQTGARPLPPLQAPPDDDYDDYYPDDEPARRPRWPWIVAAVVVLLLLAGGIWFVLNKDDGGSSGGSSTSSSSTSSSTDVLIDTNSFIGQDADAVQRDLEGKGLAVSQQNATTAQLRSLGEALGPGTVAGSDPANTTVAKGSHVTLLVAQNGYRPGGATTTTTAASTTTSARTTTAPPPTTTTPPPTTTPTTTATTTSTAVSSGSPAPTGTATGTDANAAAGGPPEVGSP
jgi:eukaryotic-like serine/threonine-protein kinase